MASIATGSDSFIATLDQGPDSWDTPIPESSPTWTFHEHHAGGFEEANEPQFSSEARNAGVRFGRVNEVGVSGSFPFDWKHKGFETMIQNVLELTSFEEVASFVVAANQTKIDFREDTLDPERHATVAAGTYTSTTLAAAIKAAMELVGDETYTVTYDPATMRWTIASAGAYLKLLWLTGANQATSIADVIGFDHIDVTDASAPVTLTAENDVIALFDNVFAVPEDLDLSGLQPDGMTWYAHKNQQTDLIENVFCQALAWTMNGNFLTFTPTLSGKKITVADASPVSPTFSSELPAVVKGALAVTINDTANGGTTYTSVNTKGLTINCPRPITMMMNDASSYAVDAAAGDKIKPEVSFSWFRNDRTTMDAIMDTRWRAGAAITATFTLTSAVPLRTGGTIYPSTTWSFIALMRKGGSSKVAGPGPIEQPYAWVAEVGPSGEPPMTLTLRNSTYLG